MDRRLFLRGISLVIGCVIAACLPAAAQTYQLTIMERQCIVQRDPAGTETMFGAEYPAGTSVELTVVPNANAQLWDWDGDLSGSQNPETIVMDGPKTAIATCILDSERVLTLEGEGTGSLRYNKPVAGGETNYNDIDWTAGTVNIRHIEAVDTLVEVEATPSEGYRFERWEGVLSGTDNPAQFSVADHGAIRVVFVADENGGGEALPLSAMGTGGGLCLAAGWALRRRTST
jgi:hypothetical protein